MKFVADEDVDYPIVERLRSDGHAVWYVAEMDAGIADEAVLELARVKDALLLTADKDFGELIFRQKRLTNGVTLLRLEGLTPLRKAEIVSAAAAAHGDEWPHNFTVITPGAMRIRRSMG